MKVHKPFGHSVSSDQLRISLCDDNLEVVQYLAVAFTKEAAVEVLEGNLLDLDCDALVSPANSFGDMSGGIDKAIDDFFQGRAQSAARGKIAEDFCGELPVGMALVLELNGKRFRKMVCAPTMRIPRNVSKSINAYLAMRAALVAIIQHNKSAQRPIRSVAVPGLCTGVGGMSYARAAEQMWVAYENVLGDGWRKVVHPIQAPYALSK